MTRFDWAYVFAWGLMVGLSVAFWIGLARCLFLLSLAR